MTEAGPWASRDRARELASGDGYVDVERIAGRSAVVASSSRSPLKLVFPRNHSEAAWVFTSTLGGGLVDGDRMRMAVRVADGAAVWLTSQAPGKVYRSPGGTEQELRATVSSSGLLVVAPDPVLCFAASRLSQRARIELADDASVVFVDALTAGRVAFGERWDFTAYRSEVQIDRDGMPLLRDALELIPRHGAVAARMGRFEAIATVVAIGPRAILARPEDVAGDDAVAAWSAIREGVLVRVAGTRASALNAALRALLSPLVANLGDDPFARKW